MRLAVLPFALGVLTSFLGKPAAAQVSNQSFEITPVTARPTVGDTVVLNFRVRLDERDLLFDTIPQPVGDLPSGVRILSVNRLARTPDRIFHGQARLAFYRTGRQPVPVFGLPFMRAVKGVQRATLTSDSAFVEVVSLLPAGDPPLKDIKGLEHRPGPPLFPFVSAAAVLLLLLALYPRLRRARRAESAVEPGAPQIVPQADLSPYQVALEQLRSVEREDWPARGQLARHYAAIADVLRDYLEAAESVPAKERTSAEVLWSLPPHLGEAGLRDRLRQILDQADLVKFARFRPEPAVARQFFQRSRALLDAWHQANQSALSDAVL